MNLFRIAWHEVRQAWRSRALPVLAVLVGLLVVGAAAVAQRRHAAEVAQRARYQSLVAQQWRAQPDRHPHRVSHYGFLVFRPPAPLGFVDSGVERFTGATIFLEAHRQNTANFSDAAQAEGTRQFGELTMATALQLLLPLLVFATVGTAVTREREMGTLWLLLCQGTPWRAILWGKLAGAVLVSAMLVAPGVLMAGAGLAIAGGAAFDADTAARASVLAVAHAMYLTLCAGLALLVSARCRTTRAAVLTLVGLWMVLWIIVPRALPGVAAALYPMPARALFEAAVERRVRQLGDSHNPNDPKFQAIKKGYLAKYGVPRVEDLPLNYNGVVMFEGEKLTTDAYRQYLSDLEARYSQQSRLVEWASLVSPFVGMRVVSMALAGVDLPHARAFERRVEDYRYSVVQKLNELHMHEVTYARDRYEGGAEAAAPSRQRIDRAHFQRIETFAYDRPRVGWALAHGWIGGAGLLAWTIATLTALAMYARRPLRV